MEILAVVWAVTFKMNCLPFYAVCYFTINRLAAFSLKRITFGVKGSNYCGGSAMNLVANIANMSSTFKVAPGEAYDLTRYLSISLSLFRYDSCFYWLLNLLLIYVNNNDILTSKTINIRYKTSKPFFKLLLINYKIMCGVLDRKHQEEFW